MMNFFQKKFFFKYKKSLEVLFSTWILDILAFLKMHFDNVNDNIVNYFLFLKYRNYSLFARLITN